MGGLKNKKFADIVENLFGMARLRMYVQIIAEKNSCKLEDTKWTFGVAAIATCKNY